MPVFRKESILNNTGRKSIFIVRTMKKIIAALGLCLILLTGTQAIRAQDKKVVSKTEEQIPEIDFPSLPPAATIFPREGVRAVEKNGKYGFKEVGVGGALIIPYKYEDVGSFSGGLAAVQLNGKWGFIDKKNKVVIPFKYDGAGKFSEGLAAVSINRKYGFIDRAGALVIPYQYDYVMWTFKEGLVPVELNGRYGYIDINGKTVIPFKYGSADEFKDGKAEVWLGNRKFYIDRKGNEIEE